MIHIYYQVPVSNSLLGVWEVLVDKVRFPAKYISGVEAVRFEDRADGKQLRVMERNDITVQEIIEVDAEQRTTTFTLHDHPQYEGSIKTEVIEEDGTVYLCYAMAWSAHTGEEEAAFTHLWFRKAVMATKAQAEEHARIMA